MFYKKKGKPLVDEIVLCTVKKILYHSVFVSIDDYENLDGMIHISEIAPGRIRNLRDYVIEGKKIVCKVLNINLQGQIDLSLRRVTTTAMVNKLKDYKQEEKTEKLFEQICKDFNMNLEKFYSTSGNKIVETYGGLYPFILAVVENGRKIIDEFKLNPKFEDALYETIKDKIKPSEVTISGTLNLKSYSESGIEEIKSVLSKLAEQKISVHYLGAPKYKLSISSSDYKKAENIMKNGIKIGAECAKKLGCDFNFVKND